MKINILLLKENTVNTFEEDIDFGDLDLTNYHVHKIDFVHAVVKLSVYENLISMDINITSDVHTTCAYSLEDTLLHLKFSDNLLFSTEEKYKEDGEVIYLENNYIDVDSIVFEEILSEVPFKVIKKGKSLPTSGEGYRVLSESDYLNEKNNKKDNRWKKLDDLNLD